MAGEIKKVLFSEGVTVDPPSVLNLDLTTDVTGTLPIGNGGTGQTTAGTAFGALSPMTTDGDIITRASGVPARLGIGTDGQVLGVVSGALAYTDGGGGSGEKNYITNPSAKSAITGWTAVGELGATRTTTAAELPREYSTGAGIKVTATPGDQGTGNNYVYFDFNLDDVDLSKKLKIQWSQKLASTYAAGQLAVVITTQADRTTALHTPITTAIPAADGVFTTSFDASTTAALSLVIRATTDMDSSAGIVISDVVVGPGVGVQGAVATKPESFTPSFVSNALGTITAATASFERFGERMFASGTFTAGTVSGSNANMNIPNSLTAASTAASGLVIGRWWRGNGSASTRKTGNIFVIGGNNFVYFSSDDQAAASSPFVAVAASSLIANSEVVSFEYSLDIAEWSGSGTINIASGESMGMPLVYKFDQWTPSSTGSGVSTNPTAGSTQSSNVDITVGSISSGTQTFTFSRQGKYLVTLNASHSHAQVYDYYYINTTLGGTASRLGNGTDVLAMVQGEGDSDGNEAQSYTLVVEVTAPGQTFTVQPTGVSSTLGGVAANHNFNFGVVIQPLSAIGKAVGYGQATATSLGLVKGGSVPGQVSGAAVSSGYLGETSSSSGTITSVNKTTYAVSSAISVPAGIWDVFVMASAAAFGDAAGITGVTYIFSTDNTTTSAGGTINVNRVDFPATTSAWGASLGPIRVNVSAATNYYLKTTVSGTTASTLQTSYNVNMNRVG